METITATWVGGPNHDTTVQIDRGVYYIKTAEPLSPPNFVVNDDPPSPNLEFLIHPVRQSLDGRYYIIWSSK